MARLAFVLAVAAASCTTRTEQQPVVLVDRTAPFVLFAAPAPSATGVPRDARVSVTFSEPMDPASLATCLGLEGPAGAVPGTVTASADGSTVTFAPAALLEPLAGYAASLAAGPVDRSGNAAAPSRWAFRTAAEVDVRPPRIVARTPSSGSVLDPAEARTVTVTFDEPLDCAALPVPALSVLDEGAAVAGNVTCTDATLSFHPAAGVLPTRTTLEVVTAPLVSDLAGNRLGAPDRWTIDVLPWLVQLGPSLIMPAGVAIAVAPDGDVVVARNRMMRNFLDPDFAGTTDVLLVRYDPAGVERWRRVITTGQGDVAGGVAVDGAGNVFVAGSTLGAFPGFQNPRGTEGIGIDAFLLKYDPRGELVWADQFGSVNDGYGLGVAATVDGDTFVVSSLKMRVNSELTTFCFVQRIAADGRRLWLNSYESVECTAVALDPAGDVRTVIRTVTTGRIDALVLKLDGGDGHLLWLRPIGEINRDWAPALTVDSAGNTYVAGTTDAVLFGAPAGRTDLFLARLDPEGMTTGIQRGTSSDDIALAVAVAGDAVYVGGGSGGDLGRPGLPQGAEAFVLRYDALGWPVWSVQGEIGVLTTALAVDAHDGVYVAGYAISFYGGGHADYFLTRLDAGGRWR